MTEMPEGWGYLEGRQEIICPHGVGHYAPFANRSTHGCDGCCNALDSEEDEDWEQAVQAAREREEEIND